MVGVLKPNALAVADEVAEADDLAEADEWAEADDWADADELAEADALAEAEAVAAAVTLATAIKAQAADWKNIFIFLFCFEFDKILEIELLIKQGETASGKFNVQ